MATYVAFAASATSPALPAGTTTGDWVVVFAARDANATPPTLPTGWTTIITRASANAILVAYREKDASWSTIPAFTNATRTEAITVRPASGKVLAVGVNAVQGATGTAIAWAVQTLQVNDGTSVILRFVAHTRTDTVLGTPTNHTIIEANGTRPSFGMYRKTTTTDMAAASLTSSRSDVWSSAQVEIKDTVAVAVSQDAYGFYADDGSLTTSTALAATNTPPTIDVTQGDANTHLRMRLQSTSAAVVPATDDWCLQWEKNASGTWEDVVGYHTPITANNSYSGILGLGVTYSSIAHSFQGDGSKLSQIQVRMSRGGIIPAGQITAELRAATGTFGTSNVPTGAALATALNTVDSSTIPTTGSWFNWSFDSTFTLVNGTTYCLVISCPASPGEIQVSTGGLSHPGNTSIFTTSWATSVSSDLTFRVNKLTSPIPTSVFPYDSLNLNDGNLVNPSRLGAGTGTFVAAGRVAEDGFADDIGWSANNYTELLYTVQLKQADLTNGDVLRFRILRNDAISSSMTYSSTPTINVTKTFPAVTQAGYRFFDQGTESGSTPLGAENTPISGNLTSGDGIGALRVLLQSTNVAPLPATDDWQLQWEKNASGGWANVGQFGDVLLDWYGIENHAGSGESLTATTTMVGQSFLGGDIPLTRVRFLLQKLGTPTGNMTAKLYALSGSFGSGSTVPTGSPLATSSPVAAVDAPSSWGWVTFTFDGAYSLVLNPYFIVIECSGSGGNFVVAGSDTSSPVAPGNVASFSGSWTAFPNSDLIFEVYGGNSSLGSYNDPALTDGQATTNRLTGTGSFSPGKVTKTGTGTDLGIPGNNFTEILYPVQISQAAFVQGDTIRFRVLRNGAAITTTQTPLINIISSYVPPKTGSATVSHSWTGSAVGAKPLPTSISTLIDSFDTSLDTVKWGGSASSPIVVWESGRIKIESNTDYTGDLRTPAIYDLAGSSIFAKVTPPTAGEFFMRVRIDPGFSVNFYWWDGHLEAEYADGGSPNTLLSRTYSPTNDAWLRIRESGGTTYWDTSPDSSTWNNFASVTTPSWIASHSECFLFFESGSDPTQYAYVDNVNVPGVTGPPPNSGSATATWSETVTASGVAPPTGTTVTDDFNRADSGTLGANWIVASSGQMSIVSNRARGGTACVAFWNANFSNDQYCEGDFTMDGTEVGPMVRVGVDGWASGYLVDWHAGSGGTFQWFKRIPGTTFTSLGVIATGVGTSGTKRLRLEVSGSTLSFYDNGILLGTTTDTTHTSGSPGIWADGGASFIDNFLAGYLVGGTPPNTGSATATWSEAISAQGKKSPIATSTASWTETITATGKRTPRATATASWTETITATGKRTPRATATANFVETVTGSGKKSPVSTAIANYLETVVAAGKKFQKAIATANFLETISVTTKRSPIATSTANHSWTTIAQGVKPVVGVKQGTAIASWSEALTAAGKRSPKATATTQFTENVTTNGTKPQRGTTTASWLETIAAAGKRDPKATATANYTENPGAAGKRTPKATSAANHSWTSIAQGFKPVVGQKQGSAIASWSETITATGKRTPKATSTTLYTENVTAAGKKIQKSTVTTTWTNAITAAGKKIQKATSVTAYSYDAGAVGKKTPKGSTTAVNHSWTLIAQGVKPVVGSKQGSALVFTAWTGSAVGKKAPKATASAVWTETTTAFGKKLQNGSGIVLWTEKVSVFGAKPLRGSTIVTWSESVIVSGKRIPKAIGFVFHNWVGDAEGKYNPLGISTLEILWQLSAIGVDERGIVILNDATSIHLGSQQVKAVYLGSEKVWEML